MKDSQVSKYVRVGDRRQIEADIDWARITETIRQVEPWPGHTITRRWATQARILAGGNHAYRCSLHGEDVGADVRRRAILAGDGNGRERQAHICQIDEDIGSRRHIATL